MSKFSNPIRALAEVQATVIELRRVADEKRDSGQRDAYLRVADAIERTRVNSMRRFYKAKHFFCNKTSDTELPNCTRRVTTGRNGDVGRGAIFPVSLRDINASVRVYN